MKLLGIVLVFLSFVFCGIAASKKYLSLTEGIEKAEKLINTIIDGILNDRSTMEEILQRAKGMDEKTDVFIDAVLKNSEGKRIVLKKEIAEEQDNGKRIEQKFDNQDIKSVLSASIGILAKKKDGSPFVYKLLKKNMAYPTEKKQVFRVPTDKAERQSISVYEGESDNSENCNLLGTVELKLDGKLSFGEPIEVTLIKDKNGILQVEAIHQQSGIHIKSEIKRENGLSENDVKNSTDEMEELWLA